MSKKNDDFFVEKKDWSFVKDELFACYFKPYISKILHTHRPLLYVDCFAGKGKFDDGNPGSPLIALYTIEQCETNTKMANTNIEVAFIDLNYANDLKENLKNYPWVKIIAGKYEDKIHDILKNKNGYNVFLYLDPYGIKSLRCTQFDKFANSSFYSIELLINMNSFGFIREACRAMGASFEDDELFIDLIEYAPSKMDVSDKSITELNEIAGGDYWQDIIEQMKKGTINGYKAETLFVEQFCRRMRYSYKYVLNMPLRIKRGQRPKYRMIHATNHSSGCLLMVDNICNRWQSMQEIQTSGQIRLFEENYDNQIIDINKIYQMVIEHFSRCNNWIGLSESLAMFFMLHGPICKTGDVTRILKTLEQDNRIEIMRNPARTEKGHLSTFMTEDKGKTIFVRWRF